RSKRDWSSDVCSSDLSTTGGRFPRAAGKPPQATPCGVLPRPFLPQKLFGGTSIHAQSQESPPFVPINYMNIVSGVSLCNISLSSLAIPVSLNTPAKPTCVHSCSKYPICLAKKAERSPTVIQ